MSVVIEIQVQSVLLMSYRSIASSHKVLVAERRPIFEEKKEVDALSEIASGLLDYLDGKRYDVANMFMFFVWNNNNCNAYFKRGLVAGVTSEAENAYSSGTPVQPPRHNALILERSTCYDVFCIYVCVFMYMYVYIYVYVYAVCIGGCIIGYMYVYAHITIFIY